MLGNETKDYFEAFFLVVYGMDFYSESGEIVPCQFCVGRQGDGHLFWDCPYRPLMALRESPEFNGFDVPRQDGMAKMPIVAWLATLPV